MTLATLALAASLAFAQNTAPDPSTTPGDTPGSAPITTLPADEPVTAPATTGTIDNVPADSTMTTQQESTPAIAPGTVESRRDTGWIATMMWAIPLIVVLALLWPVARKWSQRRSTDIPAQPRV